MQYECQDCKESFRVKGESDRTDLQCPKCGGRLWPITDTPPLPNRPPARLALFTRDAIPWVVGLAGAVVGVVILLLMFGRLGPKADVASTLAQNLRQTATVQHKGDAQPQEQPPPKQADTSPHEQPTQAAETPPRAPAKSIDVNATDEDGRTGFAVSPRDIAKQVSPSVVLLVMEDANGQPLAMGSGFVVQEGVVATNQHVIEAAAGGYAKLAGQNTKYNVRGVVASDPARDLVLLAVDGLKAAPLNIGDSAQVAVGDQVYAIGNPQGLEGTFSAGIVSGVRKVGKDSLLQITAPISPGSSGGPVTNNKGEVIGVAVATFKEGQNLNFAIPSQYLLQLIPTIKASVALSEPDKTQKGKKKESIVDEMGERSTEGVTASHFRWTTHLLSSGLFSLSLRNDLREPVRDISCLVIFWGEDDQPIETVVVRFKETVLPGLAKRVAGSVHDSVQELTTPKGRPAPTTKVEFRILHFVIEDREGP